MITIKPSDGPLEGQTFEVEERLLSECGPNSDYSLTDGEGAVVFLATPRRNDTHYVDWDFDWYESVEPGVWKLIHQLPREKVPVERGKMFSPDWEGKSFAYLPAESFPKEMWVDAPLPRLWTKDPDNDMNNKPNTTWMRWTWYHEGIDDEEVALKRVMRAFEGKANPQVVRDEWIEHCFFGMPRRRDVSEAQEGTDTGVDAGGR